MTNLAVTNLAVSNLAQMSEPEQLFVLHALRLRGPASDLELASRFSMDLDEVKSTLEVLRRCELARLYEGRLAGWMLTATGRAEGERLLAEQLDRLSLRGVVAASYQQFLVMNPELLSICTDWQVHLVGQEEVLNDHLDTARDAVVLARLAKLHEHVVPLLEQLAAGLQRFEGYSSRLRYAHERIGIGQTEWLTGPRIDSYHTVWFELHEDFLATLGRRRSDERVDYDSAEDGSAELEE